MKKKLLACLMALALCLTLLPTAALAALDGQAGASTPMLAEIPGNYFELSWKEDENKVVSAEKPIPDDAIEITTDNAPTTWGEEGKDSYYVASGNVEIKSNIPIKGNVHLILADSCSLTTWQIVVKDPNSNSLTICAQSADVPQMGKLNCAHIGYYSDYPDTARGKITIHGGNITAKGGIGGAGTADITIYGGKITAIGGNDNAGIGGGYRQSGGTINIYGGEIDATGSKYGAGIGGGVDGNGGNINIYDRKITATGGMTGAGIGGGADKSGGTITITGGEIVATGGSGFGASAGIGGSTLNTGGGDKDGGTITISGSNTKITAIGYNGNDIGGAGSRGATITIDPEATVQGKDGGPVKIGASHRASAAWKWNDTQHWHPCEVKDCTDTSHQSQREGHDFNDGTVDESGNLVKACTANCGYSKTLILQSISVTTQPTLSIRGFFGFDRAENHGDLFRQQYKRDCLCGKQRHEL